MVSLISFRAQQLQNKSTNKVHSTTCSQHTIQEHYQACHQSPLTCPTYTYKQISVAQIWLICDHMGSILAYMGKTRGTHIFVVGKHDRPRCRLECNTMFPAW
jgi:hypothetical protein